MIDYNIVILRVCFIPSVANKLFLITLLKIIFIIKYFYIIVNGKKIYIYEFKKDELFNL